MDILHDGGRAVRLLVQRCLILGLCLFSSVSSADYFRYRAGYGLFEFPTPQAACDSLGWFNPVVFIQTGDLPSEPGGFAEYGKCDDHGVNVGSVDALRFAGDDPLEPQCPSPNFIDPDSGECVSPIDDPRQCYEQGLIFDADPGRCVQDCPDGQLNGVCLEDIGDNAEECNSDSANYKGYIGNGVTRYNLCTSNMECDGGAFGLVNGTPACIPDEYGPPTCPSDGVVVIDEFGFVCESVSDAPEEPEIPEEPNTDTDGDGVPDEYRRENDPTSVDKGLDNVRDGISETNDKLDGSNQRLDKVVNALDAANDNLVEGFGTANETLNDINDKLDGPEGGYNTDGLGDAPTFQESAERLRTIIATNSTIQAVTTIPSIASNNTCPVWIIPATDYWSAMTMDSHCQILNDHRGLLSTIFIAVWTLAAVFVFLRA
ncbi:hypothetical protein [Marinobacter lutaoensis]|uniref:hypothetical protein n=1 Tax=Marinobacter lutaoensis TaxID=135739 RepID=UPI001594CF90|nr:hypothetical protein [Marinobacter lutaoensis]NVD34706.1 hypothetical protein [Marinobacter lutaoensis]